MAIIYRDVVFFMSDEATFQVSGNVNEHNCVFSSTDQTHEVRENTRSFLNVNLWCVISKFGVLGLHFIINDHIVTADFYLDMLPNFIVDNPPLGT